MAEKFKAPKFNIDDLVKEKSGLDRDAGRVLSFVFIDGEWCYKISSKYADQETNSIVVGVKTLKESEMVAVKEIK